MPAYLQTDNQANSAEVQPYFTSLQNMGDLHSERNFLAIILDTMDVLVIVLDSHGQIVHFNRACERLLGYTSREVKQKLTTGVLPLPSGIQAIKVLLNNIRSRHNENQCENEWVDSSDDRRTIAWTISVSTTQNNEVEYIFATGIDITSRKMAEKLLEHERALLHGLINSIPDLIFYKDLNGNYTGCNTAFEAFRGETAAEIVGQTDTELYGPDLGSHFSESDKRAIQYGKPLAYENWTRNSRGQSILIETRKSPYYDATNELLGVIGIGRDITKHRNAEQALRKANSEIEQLIDSLSSVLIVIDPLSVVTQWNPSAIQIFGISAQKAKGQKLTELPISWEWQAIADALAHCRSDLRPVFLDPIEFKRLDGSKGYLGINLSPILHDRQVITGFIILAGDITERKLLENRLSQAQKLESIGRLAAGIAHEINTPIQYIGDNTRFIRDSFSATISALHRYQEFSCKISRGTISRDEISEFEATIQALDLPYLFEEVPLAIGQTLDGIHRVSEIVQAMREFSHPGVKEKTFVDLNKAIENTLTVTKGEWKYVADVEMDLDPNLPRVLCIPGEISQVFLNIIVNASQAIEIKVQNSEERGLIRIKTSHHVDCVEIRISDTGIGIPKAIQSRVFEPFYTTKDIGKGTGQGLAIAYDVVTHKHGGTLTLESTPGEGTTFIIRLPSKK